MTNLPQTWQFHDVQFNTGVIASIVIPAGRGLSHVLTDLDASVIQPNFATLQYIVEVLDGALILFTRVLATGDSTGPPATVSADEYSDTGLNLIGSTNTTMTVQFTGTGPATSSQQLVVKGYDL